MQLDRGWQSWLAFIAGLRRETVVSSPYTKFGRNLVIDDLQVVIVSTKEDRQTGEQAKNYRGPSIIVGGGLTRKTLLMLLLITKPCRRPDQM